MKVFFLCLLTFSDLFKRFFFHFNVSVSGQDKFRKLFVQTMKKKNMISCFLSTCRKNFDFELCSDGG